MATIRKEPILNDTYYGIDSEFRTGKKNREVYSIQVASRTEKLIFTNRKDFLYWFLDELPHNMFAFNLLPELGSFQLMGFKNIKVWNIGCQLRGSLQPDPSINRTIVFYDIQPISNAFGLYTVEQLGEFLGFNKLPHEEECLGCKHYPCPKNDIRWKCEKYAIRDAEIVVKFMDFCNDKCGFDIREVVSTASIAQRAVKLPIRMKRYRKKIVTKERTFIRTYTIVPPLERKIREMATFAGRSEAFWTGFIPEAFYNDITSLYPLAILTSECLQYDKVEECDEDDLNFKPNLEDNHCGWVLGKFRTHNDFWGLPKHTGVNIVYVTGDVFGFYNTWDLQASKAEPLEIYQCYKAVKGESIRHELYENFFWEKLDDDTPGWKKRLNKGILNGLSGKLGQRKPVVSNRTNFPAYSALLAKSHQLMSWFFDYIEEGGGNIFGMDTDSAFSDINLGERKLCDINGYPFRTSLKGQGKLIFVRAKQYLWMDLYGRKYNAFHGWHYLFEDYRKAILSGQGIKTTQQIRRTPKTQIKKAQELPLGYWYSETKVLTDEHIERLFKGDCKRKRNDYNSIDIAQNKKAVPSQAWDIDELYDNPLFKKLPPDYNAPPMEAFRI